MSRYVFGPVPSRRLGISLGIDIVPFKTCTLDCIYCECGQTSDLRVERESFVSAEVVRYEIEAALKSGITPDVITVTGSGEPTLNSNIGQIIRIIKGTFDTKVAVITNGTTLSDPEVREDLLHADLVLPSLDTVFQQTFNALNKGSDKLKIEEIIDGLVAFRERYSGEIWLEIFIAKEINDNETEYEGLLAAIKKIRPDRAQLNTLDRPPAYQGVRGITFSELESIRADWSERVEFPVDIIKKAVKRDDITQFSTDFEIKILETIKRRPLSLADLIELTGKNRQELNRYLDVLIKEKTIKETIVGSTIFLEPANKGGNNE